MSDGRVAVLSGLSGNVPLSIGGDTIVTMSCEALMVGEDEHLQSLAPIQIPRSGFTCAAVAGCIIDSCRRVSKHIS
jgi:hypothetical protein